MKKGELWILKLPFTNGKEQRGKRPALILADTKTNLVIVIPLTSNPQALRFPYTLEIKKSKDTNLEKDSIALILIESFLGLAKNIVKRSRLDPSQCRTTRVGRGILSSYSSNTANPPHGERNKTLHS